ncbi:exportin-2 [Carex littledalei]|uniref:Exportin-2 n=1 Tax=Carex littledalei TaxID=544730 RepID=A0A833R2K4_9POAL|nr:exportin-2 [Carex littledalei]
MEVPQETLDRLSTWFLQSLSLDASLRRAAESSLLSAATTPGFPLALLKLSSIPSVDLQIRLASALHFKNLLKSRWAPTSDNPLPDSDKALIKSLLLPLLLQSPPLIQSQLSEALAIASSHDFPSSWPTLLPDIISSLGTSLTSGDYTSVNSLLSAANSLFLKFRHSFDTQTLRLDLKYCLDLFAKPLLETFLNTSNLTTAASNPSVLKPLLECQRLCSEIFHSLNSIELPEFFEDHMREWMEKFRFYLTNTFAPQVETDGTADALRASICENLQLYMEKNEEEFKDYLEGFATAVWGLLMNATKSPSRDQLAVTAIKFLTTVSTSVHHALFGSPEVLGQICNSVVFPNLRLRDDDEELFENNYVEYIRRDSEGSDTDTLRRTACELLKGLAVNYREQVTGLVSAQVQSMLAAFNTNPAQNWKEKDAAIYLVVALSPRPGATIGYLVDVESFFTSVIVPELQGQDPNAVPILKAGALKFFTVFREQIPKSAVLSLLPGVIRFLGSESNVVHSYAATCIEKLLLVKDKGALPGPTARYGAADLDPFVPQMLTGLFNALQMPDSQENPYVMKCIMRVLGVANLSGEVATGCITKLVSVLTMVCENPKNPLFNHYLFEALAAVIRRAGERDASVIPIFEKSLFPELEKILVKDISEFWSYAFQIFTLLIDLRAPPLSDGYMALFQVILDPSSWKRSGSVPALVRLLQAFLRKMPNELNREGRLGQVLGIFSQLISVNSTEELGFFVLNTVVENLSYEIISPYVGNIWGALFGRLQSRRVYKFVSPLVIFMSLFLIKYGPAVLVDSINSIQQGLFLMILQQFWIPYSTKISGTVEQKLITVALTRLICESPLLLDPAASENWGKLVDGIVQLLTNSDQAGADLEDDAADVPETIEYTGSFAKLHSAGKKDDDPLKEIRDPKQFFVSSVAGLSAQFPGRFGPVIQQFVSPANQTALVQLCGTYNSAIV